MTTSSTNTIRPTLENADGYSDGESIAIDPQELSITRTHADSTTSNFYLVQNHDLLAKSVAGTIVRSAEDGAIVIALGVDDDHDEIHYRLEGDDAAESIRRGISLLTASLVAMGRVSEG